MPDVPDPTCRERQAILALWVTQVWPAVGPRITLHGHMHVADERTYDGDRRVISLCGDNQTRNLGILDLGDLSWS